MWNAWSHFYEFLVELNFNSCLDKVEHWQIIFTFIHWLASQNIIKIQSCACLGKISPSSRRSLWRKQKTTGSDFSADFRVQKRNTWFGGGSWKSTSTPECCPHELTLNPAASPEGRVELTWNIEETRLALEGWSNFPLVRHILPDYSSQTKVFSHFVLMLHS